MTNLGQAAPPVKAGGQNWRSLALVSGAAVLLLGGAYFGWTNWTNADRASAADEQVERSASGGAGQRMAPLEFKPEPQQEPAKTQPAAAEQQRNNFQKNGTTTTPAGPSPMASMFSSQRDTDAFTAVEQERAPAAGVGVATADDENPHSAFLRNASLAPRGRGVGQLTPPPGELFLKRSVIIQATMLNTVNSELPGDAAAIINQDVLDSGTLRYVLIPATSILYGKYNPNVKDFQRRNQIAWTSVELPENGGSLDLGSMVGTDASGAAGVEGYVDRHLGGMGAAIGGAAFFSVLGQAGQIMRGDGGETNVGVVGVDAAGRQTSTIGNALVQRQLTRPNTLGLDAGDPVAVMLSDRFALPAWNARASR